MKLSRILTLPFAAVADICTLGNIGSTEGSFTQQVFDAEADERHAREVQKANQQLIEFIKAIKK